MATYTHNPDGEIGGTSLIGTIDIAYENLVRMFGSPELFAEGESDKVDAEWVLQFEREDGSVGVVAVYNWKDGKCYCGSDGLEVFEITNWHIGGRKTSDAIDFKDYVESWGIADMVPVPNVAQNRPQIWGTW